MSAVLDPHGHVAGHHDDHHVHAPTGWGRDEDRAPAHAVGFDAHPTKPVDPPVLLRLIAG